MTKIATVASLFFASYLCSYFSQKAAGVFALLAMGSLWFFTVDLDGSVSNNQSASDFTPKKRQIGNVIQDGYVVKAYDDEGRFMFTFNVNPGGRVIHFSSNSINVQTGAHITIYDAEKRITRSYNT